MFQNILVLCLGNICRSPVAHVLLQEKTKATGIQLTIDSAGLTALVGNTPHPFSLKLLELHKIPITIHLAKQVTLDMTRQADLILVMDNQQRRILESKFSGISGKIFRLGHFGHFDIPDPYGQGIEAFEKMYDLIDQATDEWMKHL